MLSAAHLAKMQRPKLELLYRLSERLELLRVCMRLVCDMKCLEVRQYEYFSKQIDEIGRQLGGWIKQ